MLVFSNPASSTARVGRHLAIALASLRGVSMAASPALIGTVALAVALPFCAAPAYADSFTVAGASGTAQTLGKGAGQTGKVEKGGVLAVAGSANAVTISGNQATLTNLGSIAQTGDGRAFRLLGDYSANASFLALLGATTIDGLAASYKYDGLYTNVTAVPEPSGYALMLAGLGLFGVLARRRKSDARGDLG